MTAVIRGLAIGLPVLYMGFIVYRYPVVGTTAQEGIRSEWAMARSELGALRKELALVQTDLGAIKKVNAELTDRMHRMAGLVTGPASDGELDQRQHVDREGADLEDRGQGKPEDPDSIARKQEEDRAEVREWLDKAFWAESQDQQWAPITTNLITGFFASEPGTNLSVTDLQCRTSLCRIALGNVDQGKGADALTLHLPMHVSQALSGAQYFYERNDDGTTNVTIYFNRKGADFPAGL